MGKFVPRLMSRKLHRPTSNSGTAAAVMPPKSTANEKGSLPGVGRPRTRAHDGESTASSSERHRQAGAPRGYEVWETGITGESGDEYGPFG